MHVPLLVATIAIALSAALVFGTIASWLRLSPIVGYLLAGIAIGPHAPGFVADAGVAADLAEMGVALLMFGVGLHFSPRDLAAVRSVAIPGALVQSTVATVLGVAVGIAWGWGAGGGLVLGLAVSVASTVVLVRGLADNGLLDSQGGRTAIGWLIVEDLLTVVILVMLPGVSGSLGGVANDGAAQPMRALAETTLKVALLVVLVIVVGRRVIPWLLDKVARTRSRELFTLSVLGIALGIACGASYLTGVSLALGAFLGGMVVGQSDLSHRAAADSIPLRDAFAVLFFVSVGMLFDPALVLEAPGLLAATLGIILVAKPLAALAIVLLAGRTLRVGLAVAAGLAQVGEFSFIMARVGSELELLPPVGHDAVLAGALVSITINPLLFRLVDPVDRRLRAWPPSARWLQRMASRAPLDASLAERGLAGHVVLCGSGRVGTIVGRVLERKGWPVVVVELDRARADRLRERGLRVVEGDACAEVVLEHARLADAALLVVAYDDSVGARLTIEQARRLAPLLPIVVRVSSRAERDHFEAMPMVHAVMGEFEAAVEIARRSLLAGGMGHLETEATLRDLRSADRGDAGDLGSSLVEMPVGEGSAAAGRAIAALGLSQSARIVTVRRGGEELIARGDTVLAAGDRILVLADRAGRGEVERLVAPG